MDRGGVPPERRGEAPAGSHLAPIPSQSVRRRRGPLGVKGHATEVIFLELAHEMLILKILYRKSHFPFPLVRTRSALISFPGGRKEFFCGTIRGAINIRLAHSSISYFLYVQHKVLGAWLMCLLYEDRWRYNTDHGERYRAYLTAPVLDA